ncbi:helix-turn-helix domain-containing protein [Devosia sp. MC532]|nr:helix-turn-helix domain-containing protein [Devosia sp. MC532]
MNKDQREIARKLRIIQHADQAGDVSKTCRYFGIGRSSFYRWQAAYRKHGGSGLVNRPRFRNGTPIGRRSRSRRRSVVRCFGSDLRCD